MSRGKDKIQVVYRELPLEPKLQNTFEPISNSTSKITKLQHNLFSIIDRFQTHKVFQTRVLGNMMAVYVRKLAIYQKDLKRTEKELKQTVASIQEECAFMTEHIYKQFTCDKTAESNTDLQPLIKKKKRQEALIKSIETKVKNLQSIIDNRSRLIIDETEGTLKLSATDQLIIDMVKCHQTYVVLYNRLILSLKSIMIYANRINIITFLRDLLWSWYRDPSKIFKEYMNICIMGEPGSGKTVLASALSQLFSSLGIVTDVDYNDDNTAYVKEYTASNFIAQYSGQTGPKTLGVLNENIEKVLFVDEAYAIVNDMNDKNKDGEGGGGYGFEALTEIVNFLSTNIGKCVLIVAGYEDEMREFLGANVGLDRRIPYKIILNKIDADSAVSILQQKLLEYNPKYKFTFGKDFYNLYNSLQKFYDDTSITDRKKKAKFLAKTLFGNGIGSIVNFAAKMQKMIELTQEALLNRNARSTNASMTINKCILDWTIDLYVSLNAVMKRDTPDEIAFLEAWLKRPNARNSSNNTVSNSSKCSEYVDYLQTSFNAKNNAMNVFMPTDKLANTNSQTKALNPNILDAHHCQKTNKGVECFVTDAATEYKYIVDDLKSGAERVIRNLTIFDEYKRPKLITIKSVASEQSYLIITSSEGQTIKLHRQGHKKTWYVPEDELNNLYVQKINQNF